MIGPEDLHEVRFERELRGYSPEEVNAFVDQVVFAWRTGSAPDALLELLHEARFSITVRGYKRADVDRAIDEITTRCRHSPKPSSRQPMPHRPRAASPDHPRIDPFQEHAMSEPSVAANHSCPLDQSGVSASGDDHSAAPLTESLPADITNLFDPPPTVLADHRAGDVAPSLYLPIDDRPQRTTAEPLAEPVEPDHAPPLRPPPRATEPGQQSTPDSSPSNSIPEVSAAERALAKHPPATHRTPPLASANTEPRDADPNKRMEEAERLLRLVDDTRLRLIGVLDQAAHDLAHPPTPLTARQDDRSAPTQRSPHEPNHAHKPRNPTTDKPKKTKKSKKK
jgi:DivIVA domain-containing protein